MQDFCRFVVLHGFVDTLFDLLGMTSVMHEADDVYSV